MEPMSGEIWRAYKALQKYMLIPSCNIWKTSHHMGNGLPVPVIHVLAQCVSLMRLIMLIQTSHREHLQDAQDRAIEKNSRMRGVK
jgi:hypothetical protein